MPTYNEPFTRYGPNVSESHDAQRDALLGHSFAMEIESGLLSVNLERTGFFRLHKSGAKRLMATYIREAVRNAVCCGVDPIMFAHSISSFELQGRDLDEMPHVPKDFRQRLGWFYWVTVGVDPRTMEVFTLLSRFPAEHSSRWVEAELSTAMLEVWLYRGFGDIAGVA